jgi:hypothetical protein
MPTRVQTLRSSLKGVRPANGTREVGELYTNFADRQIGVVNAAKSAVDLLAVRFFMATADYAAGDYVVQAGQLYRALNSVAAGAFNASDWVAVSMVPADLLAAIKTVDGSGSGLDADLLDGLDSSVFATVANVSATYAPIASPVFTGDPRAPTVANTDADTSIATTQFVKSVRLDMFASPFASVGMNGQQITNLGNPSNAQDAATKAYVDAKPAGAVISDTPPASPSQGQTWWESDTGAFNISYNDGNTTQWVQINASGFPEAPSDGSFYGRANGAWVIGASKTYIDNADAGKASGPASAHDNGVVRFDGTTGKLIQDSNTTLDDSGNLTLGGFLTTATYVVSSAANLYLGTNGAGTISFRPNGIGSATGEVYVNSLGNLIADSGIVRSTQFGSTGAFIGYSAATDCYLRPNGGGSTSGQLRLSTNGVLVMVHDTQQKPTAGQWSASSDARIKNVLRDYEGGLEAILALRPRVFTYKGNDTSEDPAIDASGNRSELTPLVPYPTSPHHQLAVDQSERVGLIAQEAQVAMPDIVTVSDITTWIDGIEVNDALDVNPTNIMYALVNAVKALAARVEALEAARV